MLLKTVRFYTSFFYSTVIVLLVFQVCNKQFKLYGRVSYPRHNGPFARVITLHFHMLLINHWTFMHINFALSVFLFYFYFVYTAMLLHTLTYQTTDPCPLWTPLITVLLFPIMTLKIRSTEPRTKVRKIVRYLENLLDYYSRKKGPYNLMKSRFR